MLFVQNLFRRSLANGRRRSLLCRAARLVRSMNEQEMPEQTRYRRPAATLMRLVSVMIAWIFGTAAGHAAELAPHDMVLLDRLTWGINASSAARLQAVGTERWLTEQLHPAGTTLPDAAKTQIEAMPHVHKFPFDIAVAFDAPSKSANQVADSEQKKAAQQVYQQAMNDRAKQAAARTILRALYAPDQLRERMTWFWFNHFNVHQYKEIGRAHV